MIKRFLLTTALVLIGCGTVYCQSASEHWDSYIAIYEDGAPGATTLRMDLINSYQLTSLKYVLVTGITYKTSRPDGFPDNETFDTLYTIGDELLESVTRMTTATLAGSFTYQSERLEYFYLKDTVGIRQEIEDYYNSNYPGYQYYLNVKEDEKWTYYTDFLYPNEQTLNYMADQSVIRKLVEAGDKLNITRRVDHYLFFKSKSDLTLCKTELETKGFNIDSSTINTEFDMPFTLHIWKESKVDIDSIHPVTSELRELAKKYKGIYDGWETSVEK